ncbi:LURP-one-related/scramblase family protein [Glutamicibacter arilaitensis]|uniref:LURP-one-related/scramblase family protein n=1 Tax=Glutamicibacter arilaitensis TaxID=256701 RepID=UPI00384DEFF3
MTIFAQDLLVFQQTKNISRNDFAIMDGAGGQIAHVETGGSALGRMFAGARQLTVFDGPDNPVIQVKDTMTMGRDRFEISDGQGAPLASLVKRVTFFKTRVTMSMQGEELDLLGSVWDFDFQITGPGGVLGTVTREWSGMGNALMGKSTYALKLAENLTTQQRQAIIGSVLALDLIREKRQRS